MAMTQTEIILKELVKELHEINRRLSRICEADILSIDTPIIVVDEAIHPEDFE